MSCGVAEDAKIWLCTTNSQIGNRHDDVVPQRSASRHRYSRAGSSLTTGSGLLN